MRATRAPANPSAENSARAAARIRSRVPWGSRAWLGRERFTRGTDGMTEFDVIVTVWILPGQASPRGRAGETGGPAGRLGEAAAQGERPAGDPRGQQQREPRPPRVGSPSASVAGSGTVGPRPTPMSSRASPPAAVAEKMPAKVTNSRFSQPAGTGNWTNPVVLARL